MITCFIEYQLDPSKLALFEQYAETGGRSSQGVEES